MILVVLREMASKIKILRAEMGLGDHAVLIGSNICLATHYLSWFLSPSYHLTSP